MRGMYLVPTRPFSKQTASTLGGTVAFATVYRNFTKNPILVVIVAVPQVGANTVINGFTDGSNPPTTLVASAGQNQSGLSCQIAFMVVPGNFWEVTNTVSVANIAAFNLFEIYLGTD